MIVRALADMAMTLDRRSIARRAGLDCHFDPAEGTHGFVALLRRAIFRGGDALKQSQGEPLARPLTSPATFPAP
jgi:hypothetical protein